MEHYAHTIKVKDCINIVRTEIQKVLQSVQRSDSECSVSRTNQSSFVWLVNKSRILLDLQDMKGHILSNHLSLLSRERI
ncbi:MAG: hypothetical protein DLM72_12135 [Candidatus Nitrosopolaris wilkensis]|nr:MAG: hypothetical protein DLM72_12135 [Candidatus Nitrosopolaris wilkensis]